MLSTLEPAVRKPVVQTQVAVVVSQADIDAGIVLDASACPVVQALHRAGYANVRVFNSRARIGTSWYAIPPELIGWIDAFDAHQQVHPERFVLERL